MLETWMCRELELAENGEEGARPEVTSTALRRSFFIVIVSSPKANSSYKTLSCSWMN